MKLLELWILRQKKGIYDIEKCLKRPMKFGDIITFSIAYYDLENASLLCDAEGKIYMVGD